MKRLLTILALLGAWPAWAQDLPLNSVPFSGGPGSVGWLSIGPCSPGQVLGWPTGAAPGCTTGGGAAGVSSINTLTGAVTLAAGTNMSLSPSGNTITFNATFPGVSCASLPALTGNVTTPGGSCVTTIAAGAVTNAMHVSMNAATIKGNPTGVAATPSDFTIQGLVNKTSPDAANDKLVLYDNSTGTLKYCTVGQCSSASSSGVTSLNTLTGGLAITAGTGITVTPSSPNISIATTVTGLSSIPADNVVGNFTGAAAVPTNGAIGNCGTALTYSTTTHSFACNAGVGTGAAWTPFTPTIAATSGTFSNVSAVGRFQQIGKTVCFLIQITIGANGGNGTAANAITASLPATAQAANSFTFAGRENGQTGALLIAFVGDQAHVFIQRYDGLYPFNAPPNPAATQLPTVSGCYEAQ